MSSHPTADLRVEEWLCVALGEASRAMVARYRGLLEPHGLTYPQYVVVALLGQEGELSVSGLADRMSLDRTTVSPLVKRLAQAGLAERRRDGDDERRVMVSLTAQGEELRHTVAGVPATVGAATGLSMEEQLALVEQLRTLTARLGE